MTDIACGNAGGRAAKVPTKSQPSHECLVECLQATLLHRAALRVSQAHLLNLLAQRHRQAPLHILLGIARRSSCQGDPWHMLCCNLLSHSGFMVHVLEGFWAVSAPDQTFRCLARWHWAASHDGWCHALVRVCLKNVPDVCFVANNKL